MNKLPRSAADPRPNKKPFYIAPDCPRCGSPLVLNDLVDNPGADPTEIWNDEFTCPKCRDGIYIDRPMKNMTSGGDRMRNPDRIVPFIEKLKECWSLFPDLRFGQLIENIYHELDENEFWNKEDAGLAAYIDKFVADHKDGYIRK